MESEEYYKKKERLALVIISALASITLSSLLLAFTYYCYLRNKLSKQKRSDYVEEGSSLAKIEVSNESGLQVFSFKQLQSATGGFGKSNVIGKGGFGLVYRGELQDGRKVAVKLMDHAGKQGEEEFRVEVELLSRLRSPYLLALIGYCSESNHKVLVYEFMANGGLQEHLYPMSGLAPSHGQRQSCRDYGSGIRGSVLDEGHYSGGCYCCNVCTTRGRLQAINGRCCAVAGPSGETSETNFKVLWILY